MDTEAIIEYNEGDIKVVRYNKPSRKNAIDTNMYIRVKNVMNDAATDNSVSVLVLTGTGDFFSSGNDFSSLVEKPEKKVDVLKDFIKAFIMFPKILVAIVNGPAIGVAATTLALCDLVFASEDSYFYTPFTKLGIVAEGCSTFTFPRLIGDRKAAELLLYNYKMSAKEALDCGFVNYLYKPHELQSKVWDKIIQVSKLSARSLRATKKLIRGEFQDQLLKTNEKEMNELNNIWSLTYKDTTGNVLNKKSKL